MPQIEKRANWHVKYSSGAAQVLGDRQIAVIASDGTKDRVGDILVPSGCNFSDYRKNPIVLADHDPRSPIGIADVTVTERAVLAKITFAPLGASKKSDEYCALAKAGVLSAVSVGFSAKPDGYKPLHDGSGGMRYERWQLLEISLVAVPCNPSALVVQRSLSSLFKSGRVLNQANQDHIDEVVDCLGKLAKCHDKAAKHLMRAMRHAAAIHASAQGGDADDYADPGNNPDDNNDELAYEAAQRKRRARAVAVLALSCEPDLEDAERARRRRMAEVLRLACSP